MKRRNFGTRRKWDMLTKDSRILVGQGREETHPLFNYSILHNIFRHLDVGTLKSARETCKFWNEEANSLLQNRTEITITWYNEVDTKSRPTLPTFMKYLETVTPRNVLFRNFTLWDWCFHSREEEMIQFWTCCGQCIRNLSLKCSCDSGFYDQSCVQNIFYNWTPNLETLNVENVRFADYSNYKPWSLLKNSVRVPVLVGCAGSDDIYKLKPMKKCDVRENIQPNYNFHTFSMHPSFGYPDFPLQWKEMFVSYPNMKRLSVKSVFHDEGVDNAKELLTNLIEFEEDNPDKLQNLKHIDVFSKVDDGGDRGVTNKLELAMELKFKLESLDFRFNGEGELSYDIVGKYIAKISPALKTLETGSGYLTIFPPLEKNVSFPNLKYLDIGLNVLSSNNMDFLEKTPKLEKLMIGLHKINKCVTEPQLFFNTITMLQLDSLRHLYLGENILTEDCVRKIGEWFPNLSLFGAILDDKLLWAVYKFLYNSLEVLYITSKHVTDAGITGLELEASYQKSNSSEPKPSSSKNCKSRKKKAKFNDTENRTFVGTSIGQMKKLRQVIINGHKTTGLSDDSVYNGFVLLTELTCLVLNLMEEPISEKAYRDLCSRRNIITLDTPNFYREQIMKKSRFLGIQRSSKIKI